MLEDQNLAINQFFTLYAMLDPIGHLPLFLSATGDLTPAERRRAALLAVLFAYAILVAFAVAGQFVLEAMGISLVSFQIAGGLIVFVFALSMVLGEPPVPRQGQLDPGRVLATAVHPLATPIIAGPGAMLAMVILTDNNRFTFSQQAQTLGVLAVVLLILLAVFLLGDPLGRLIGQGGTNIMRRIMGVILAALAVNLVLNALVRWLNLPPI